MWNAGRGCARAVLVGAVVLMGWAGTVAGAAAATEGWERVDELTAAVRGIQTLLEDLATRPEQPPDIIDAEVVDG